MISKEHLLGIPELRLAGKINAMNESQFNSYVSLLNSFIDSFPAQADKLRDSLDSKSYNAVSKMLSRIHETLTKLHADGLAKDCRKQIDSIAASVAGGIDEDALETFVENLIQSVSALSIDIQMAAHRSSAGALPAVKQRIMGTGIPSILAVDNAVMFINTLKKLLSNAPYDLHCVTSGEGALQFLQSHKPDVFLLDIEMPDMDGYELAKRIKRSGHKAPIIFITANSERKYVDKAIEVGAVGLLMKPLRINQLLEKLREFV